MKSIWRRSLHVNKYLVMFLIEKMDEISTKNEKDVNDAII